MTQSVDATSLDLVTDAENLFHARWRLTSLRSIDPELHQRLREQCALFEAALFGPDPKETRLQAEATVRGWKAALARMEELDQPHDAFMYGTDAETGLVVAIGERPPAESALKGAEVIFLTPAEVAIPVAANPILVAAKKHFPDAEVLGAQPSSHFHAAEVVGAG